MTELAQTYVHLAYDFTREERDWLIEYLEQIGKEVALDLFNQDISLYARVEEGSLKLWLTALGALYIGIGQYGSFRSGVDYMVKDGREFSERVIEVLYDKGVEQSEVIRTERRLKIPGKVQRLMKQIDRLKSDQVNSKDIEQVKRELMSVLNSIDNEKDRNLIVSAVSDNISPLLPDPLPVPKYNFSHEVILPREQDYKPRSIFLEPLTKYGGGNKGKDKPIILHHRLILKQ